MEGMLENKTTPTLARRGEFRRKKSPAVVGTEGFAYAFWIFPALMHEVQTVIVFTDPFA